MKLYTEEQLKEAFFEGINYAKSITPASMGFIEQYVAKKINLITPIELPSDEEIEEVSNIRLLYLTDKSANFRLGAKWVIEQIHNQNK